MTVQNDLLMCIMTFINNKKNSKTLIMEIQQLITTCVKR